MLFNIPQCTGWPRKTGNDLAPKVKNAKIENRIHLIQMIQYYAHHLSESCELKKFRSRTSTGHGFKESRLPQPSAA